MLTKLFNLRDFPAFLLLLFVPLSYAIFAQTPEPTPDEEPIRVDTLLINIPVVVSDREGRNVGGLKREDFTILLNGEKQEIEYFADAEAPVSVVIVLDLSGSTMPYMSAIREAAKAFVEKLNPVDQAGVLTFDQYAKIDVVSPLTPDLKKLSGKINWIQHARFDWQASQKKPAIFPDMYDAIYQALTKEFAGVTGRKAIIVLTDGVIVGRTVTPKVFEDTIIEGDTVIYPVMFLTQEHVGRGNTTIKYADLYKLPETMALETIASRTGGRLIIAAKGVDFKSAFQTVGDELRKQYVLGFQPANYDNQKPVKIALAVTDRTMRVRSKNVIRIKRKAESK